KLPEATAPGSRPRPATMPNFELLGLARARRNSGGREFLAVVGVLNARLANATLGLNNVGNLVEHDGNQDDRADDHEGPVWVEPPDPLNAVLVDVGKLEHVDAIVDDSH